MQCAAHGLVHAATALSGGAQRSVGLDNEGLRIACRGRSGRFAVQCVVDGRVVRRAERGHQGMLRRVGFHLHLDPQQGA